MTSKAFSTEKKALKSKALLISGEFDSEYVREGDIFEMSIQEYTNLCSKNVPKLYLQEKTIQGRIFI